MRFGTALAAAAVLTASLSSVASAAPRLALPQVNGPAKVGQTTLHLVDESRADPWVPSERRELMVTLWYPARAKGARPADYVTAQESASMVRALDASGTIPDDTFAKVRTNSTVDAPPLGIRAPLVVLSPGFMLPRTTLSAVAEELASRGYVVAGIGHNYEALATTFPDGHTTECVACQIKDDVRVVNTRAADTSFVLDKLVGPHPVWGGGRLIDAQRIAMIGHSIGGSGMAQALATDRRIDAGAMLDGAYYIPVTNFDRPLLQIGQPAHAPGGTWDPSWDTEWSKMTGWKRWLTIDKGDHFSFTDELLLAQQAGLPLPDLQLDPLRGIRITEAYLTAFVDQHLRGIPQPLLNGPSSCYPEIRFWAA